MHFADVHLGYQQYNSRERSNDFSRIFLYLVEQAIDQRVDFVLLAGDLFEKRTVNPLAMRVVIEGFRMLQEAGIPVVAVEGNHERARYRDQYSWIGFLDGLGYLHLLNPHFEDGRAVLEPYGEEGGAYVDLPLTGGKDESSVVRVYGLKYYGASTSKVSHLFADALTEMDHRQIAFSIVVAHARLEGQLPRYSGTLGYSDLAPLRERIDYLALGHIHKPYEVEGWIYNPGSPETWNVEEVAWLERGYYLVEVQPDSDPKHQAALIATPRRPFYHLYLSVGALRESKTISNRPIELSQEEPNVLQLEDIRPGIEDAKRYQDCVFDMLCRFLDGQLGYPECESRTIDGTERRDIVFFNVSSHGFWRMVNRRHAAIHIIFECKNTEELRLEYVNQLASYLGRPLGNFGVVVSGSPPSESLQRKAIAACNRHDKMVLSLSDEDLNRMSRLHGEGGDPAEVIVHKYVQLSRAVQ